MIIPFFLLLAFLTANTFAGNQTELCIQAYPNLQITCAVAYERRILLNEHQCRDLCLKMSAQTCQYNKIRRECELYNIMVVLQRKHSQQKEHHITSMEIGIVKKSNSFATKSCIPSIAPAIGFLLFLNGGCSLEQSSHLSGNKPDCTSGFSTYIEAIDGIQIVAEGLITLLTLTPEVCLQICTENKLSGENLLPIECHSAQYDRISKRCILFNTSITPTGNAEYTPNKDMTYFEKICISDMVGRKCNIVLRRVPQYILIGHATAVVDAPSHNYCIETCLRSLEMFGFMCRSAIHFHDYSKSNCILNKDSAKTRPQYFTNEREQKMDYIEMNECFIRRNL
ncbi:unnamed protein product [Cercopithifilaria johnstoni]|uniref:Apple domain-containing protein n=1 Tax=Cercopithifilaria johnstoni TaxID=2874296 RepID=A0A8J2LXS1_9BILA|nr:unnamed protein product [Cercopithifilaria johnstoni]